jgi:hypothetical protein
MMTSAVTVQVPNSERTGMYEVVFEKQEGKLSVSCTCLAGMNGKICRHRLALLGGNDSVLVGSSQLPNWRIAHAWVNASAFPDLLKDLEGAESAYEDAKRLVEKIRRRVQLAMNHGS